MQAPTRPLLELDGFSLRRLAAADLPFVRDLYDSGPNRLLIDLPDTPEASLAFLQELEKQPWSLLMVALADNSPIGVTATGLTNLVSLNTFLLAMFRDPERATLPLGLYVRNMFWNFPLQRMYVQFPILNETKPIAALYESVGFQREGAMRKHQAIGGTRHDVAVYGLLREDFDRFWAEKDSRLSL